MPLLEKIQKDMIDAMKSKDEARLSAVRMTDIDDAVAAVRKVHAAYSR